MKNIIVICEKNIREEDLNSFIYDFSRNNKFTSNIASGHIGNECADIYITMISDLNTEYEAEELIYLKSRIGIMPVRGVDIHIGHSNRSEKLAYNFANNLLKKWGGIIDDNLELLKQNAKKNNKFKWFKE